MSAMVAVRCERPMVVWLASPARSRERLVEGRPIPGTDAPHPSYAPLPPKLPEIDHHTLKAARNGDRAAFDAIVTMYTDRLRALAYHILRDPDLVDDALQDTFLSAYRGLPRFRGESSLGTWLHRITYTVCLGYLRRKKPPGVNLDDVEGALDSGDDPEETATQHDIVSSALATLSPEQRAAVVLVDVFGYDYAAAGKVLDVPEGTVCSRLNVARASLRAILAVDQGSLHEATAGRGVGARPVEARSHAGRQS